MNIENIIAVSGLSGLYKAVTSRGNGIIIEEFDTKNYIRKAIPNYDEDRVSLSDMKKLIKWYQFLVQKNIITEANYKLVDSKNEKSEKPKSIAKSNEEE